MDIKIESRNFSKVFCAAMFICLMSLGLGYLIDLEAPQRNHQLIGLNKTIVHPNTKTL